MSTTVTVAFAVEVFVPSVPVNITVLAPRLAHVKEVTSKLNAIEQLSVLPLSMSKGVIDAFPDASKFTVKFCTAIVGAILSTTVTVCVAVAEFPEPSVAVHVTVFAPNTKTTAALFAVVTEQLSAAVGLPKVTPLTAATHEPASTFTEISAGAVIVGSIPSVIVKVGVSV